MALPHDTYRSRHLKLAAWTKGAGQGVGTEGHLWRGRHAIEDLPVSEKGPGKETCHEVLYTSYLLHAGVRSQPA